MRELFATAMIKVYRQWIPVEEVFFDKQLTFLRRVVALTTYSHNRLLDVKTKNRLLIPKLSSTEE